MKGVEDKIDAMRISGELEVNRLYLLDKLREELIDVGF